MPTDYAALLGEIKQRIGTERVRVVLAANEAMVLLYWDIGKAILARQVREGWGAGTIDRLSHDLREAFPDMRGFSPRNLKYMRAFAAAWPDRAIVQQAAAQIPWFHNCVLLDKVSDRQTRLWYVAKAREEGWSRSVLTLQIERRLHQRQGKAITNFPRTLPPSDSDLATQAFKDPYLFDFLGTAEPRTERELERGARGPHPALPAGDGGRIRLRRPAGAPRGRRLRLPRGPAVLPPPAPPLRRRRAQGGAVQPPPSSAR